MLYERNWHRNSHSFSAELLFQCFLEAAEAAELDGDPRLLRLRSLRNPSLHSVHTRLVTDHHHNNHNNNDINTYLTLYCNAVSPRP